MNETAKFVLKLIAAGSLFGLWFAIIYFDVMRADGLIEFIKLALLSLGVHTIINPAAQEPEDVQTKKEEQVSKQSGFAASGFLIILASVALLMIPACTTTQSAQQGYVKACATYSAAFDAALQLRINGKLSRSEIDSITLLDSQVTPICTGELPADPEAATKQITTAVTTLTILEAAKKASK